MNELPAYRQRGESLKAVCAKADTLEKYVDLSMEAGRIVDEIEMLRARGQRAAARLVQKRERAGKKKRERQPACTRACLMNRF
jgi:hypothetical protein